MGKISEGVKLHFVNAPAMLAIGHPVFALMETSDYVGMSDMESGLAKVVAGTAVMAGGMGWLYDKGNKLWDKWFNITEDTGFLRKRAHECLYLSAFNMSVTPVIYPLSMLISQGLTGETPDFEDVRTGVGMAGLFGLTVGGPIIRYSVDVSKDLMGIESCDRKLYPDVLKKGSRRVKRGTYFTGLAIGAAAMIGVYCATPNSFLDSAGEIFGSGSSLEQQVEYENPTERGLERLSYEKSTFEGMQSLPQ